MNLRVVSRQVRLVQTVSKFSTVAFLNLEFYWFACKKKLENLLFSKHMVIGYFSSKCPGSNSRTVNRHLS